MPQRLVGVNGPDLWQEMPGERERHAAQLQARALQANLLSQQQAQASQERLAYMNQLMQMAGMRGQQNENALNRQFQGGQNDLDRGLRAAGMSFDQAAADRAFQEGARQFNVTRGDRLMDANRGYNLDVAKTEADILSQGIGGMGRRGAGGVGGGGAGGGGNDAGALALEFLQKNEAVRSGNLDEDPDLPAKLRELAVFSPQAAQQVAGYMLSPEYEGLRKRSVDQRRQGLISSGLDRIRGNELFEDTQRRILDEIRSMQFAQEPSGLLPSDIARTFRERAGMMGDAIGRDYEDGVQVSQGVSNGEREARALLQQIRRREGELMPTTRDQSGNLDRAGLASKIRQEFMQGARRPAAPAVQAQAPAAPAQPAPGAPSDPLETIVPAETKLDPRTLPVSAGGLSLPQSGPIGVLPGIDLNDQEKSRVANFQREFVASMHPARLFEQYRSFMRRAAGLVDDLNPVAPPPGSGPVNRAQLGSRLGAGLFGSETPSGGGQSVGASALDTFVPVGPPQSVGARGGAPGPAPLTRDQILEQSTQRYLDDLFKEMTETPPASVGARGQTGPAPKWRRGEPRPGSGPAPSSRQKVLEESTNEFLDQIFEEMTAPTPRGSKKSSMGKTGNLRPEKQPPTIQDRKADRARARQAQSVAAYAEQLKNQMRQIMLQQLSPVLGGFPDPGALRLPPFLGEGR